MFLDYLSDLSLSCSDLDELELLGDSTLFQITNNQGMKTKSLSITHSSCQSIDWHIYMSAAGFYQQARHIRHDYCRGLSSILKHQVCRQHDGRNLEI